MATLESDVNPADGSNSGGGSGAGAGCPEGRRLLHAFGEAVREMIRLHELQFQAVLDGDVTANRFDLLIHEASERKQNLKYAYMNHLQLHGCMDQDELKHS